MDIFRVINPQTQKEQERIQQHNSEAEKQLVTNLTPRSIESDCLWEMGNGRERYRQLLIFVTLL